MTHASLRHITATTANTHTVLLLGTMCLAVLLAQVDTSVVNLAVHSIGASMKAGVTGLQWVLDGYNLAYAVLLLTGGLAADLYGRRRLFLLGAGVFTAGSVLCAAASGIASLIAGRVIAGAGAALLLPASLSIIRVEWQDEQARNRALGIWAACNGLAFAVGPTLGGALVDAFGWRSVFLIAVPLGGAAIGLASFVVPESRDPAGRNFDATGQVCGALALGGLALAGIDASRDTAVASGALLVGLVAATLFLRTERRHADKAMVPLDLFRSRRFVGALTATTVMTFGMYGVLFLVPLVLQSSSGLSARAAGLALVPMAAVFFALSNASGLI
jgi:EmrB/QacA subfamily drug resistance transporter